MSSPNQQKQAHRMERKAAGLCIYCDNSTDVHLRGSRKGEHKLLCQSCMSNAQRRLAGYRAELSAHHLCLLCREPTSQRTSGPRKGEHFLHCDECRAYVRTVHRNNSPSFGQCRRGRPPIRDADYKSRMKTNA